MQQSGPVGGTCELSRLASTRQSQECAHEEARKTLGRQHRANQPMKRSSSGLIERIRSAAHGTDPWQGISADVFRRFVDVQRTQYALPTEILSAYRADLESLDRWLFVLLFRLFFCVLVVDVREYISVSLACLRAFYGFLVNSGCRDDDPTEPERPPRSTLALQRDREH